MKNGSKLVVIDSVWGHMGMGHYATIVGLHAHISHAAGGGSNDKDMKFIDEQVAAFLSEA